MCTSKSDNQKLLLDQALKILKSILPLAEARQERIDLNPSDYAEAIAAIAPAKDLLKKLSATEMSDGEGTVPLEQKPGLPLVIFPAWVDPSFVRFNVAKALETPGKAYWNNDAGWTDRLNADRYALRSILGDPAFQHLYSDPICSPTAASEAWIPSDFASAMAAYLVDIVTPELDRTFPVIIWERSQGNAMRLAMHHYPKHHVQVLKVIG